MERLLDDLFTKRASVREAALSSIIDGLKLNCRSQFAEKNFATLLYRCLNSIKKGTSKEIVLASHALGLLSLTVGCGDNSQELYKESHPVFSQALKSKNEALLKSVIDSLAIAAFVGANDFEQTEASMQIIWKFIFSKSGENAVVKKLPPSVLYTAISAWSLLLTTVDGWNLNHNHWHGATSYFLGLLDSDDRSVCIAAGEAIALICEVGCLEKFSSYTTDDKNSSKDTGKNLPDHDYSLQELQDIVSNHAKKLASHTSIQSVAVKAINGWNNFSLNVLKILEEGCFSETTLKFGKHGLQLHSFSQLLQVNFVRRILGRGFVTHMLENEFLRDVFDFTPSKNKLESNLYSAEREEVMVRVFLPETSERDYEEDLFERTQKPKRSTFQKAKTQLLNKQRMLKGEDLQPYHD
ncbi:interferon-related developmental regulator family protein / IFRD protein family [Striga hermonthica]|uniref:Interferon-related developmental regulator family protein / IFRD protein family n=1 Tax=Striga hermonthica TaxID=68872 RepID=A0A9N7NHM1_STRHE|nr:interferon-related developmental regulator family protein / IFRD protein family [Striga hermonthica]